MASRINRIDNARGFTGPDEPMSGGASEDLPEAPHVERTGADQTLLDQGLRLNRAFIKMAILYLTGPRTSYRVAA